MGTDSPRAKDISNSRHWLASGPVMKMEKWKLKQEITHLDSHKQEVGCESGVPIFPYCGFRRRTFSIASLALYSSREKVGRGQRMSQKAQDSSPLSICCPPGQGRCEGWQCWPVWTVSQLSRGSRVGVRVGVAVPAPGSVWWCQQPP